VSNSEILIEMYPRLYHMAHEGAWASIERFGLLSTSALLDLFEITDARRHELESCRRGKSEEIKRRTHGTALLRDQILLNEKKLAKALLDDLKPPQPMAFSRGLNTFLPIDEYPIAERRRKYGINGAVAEITVDYSVPDVREYVTEVYEIGGGEPRRDLLS